MNTYALFLAGLGVWALVSSVAVAILTGWVIALREQEHRNHQRLAFLEHDYEDRHGVHPFKVRYTGERSRSAP